MTIEDARVGKLIHKAQRRARVSQMAQGLGYASERDFLYDLYVTQMLSQGYLASTFGMAPRSVREMLIENDIPIREMGKRAQKGVALTKALVDEINRDGIPTVAARLGLDYNTLRYHMVRWVMCRNAGSRPMPPHTNETVAAPLVQKSESVSAPQVEPKEIALEQEPVMHVHGRRITEHDVKMCLQRLDDNVLRDYETGKLSKVEAYEMTRGWLKAMG
jgi:hypothetical protein